MKKLSVKKRKSLLMWFLFVDILLLSIMSATLAYFTSFDQVTNRFIAIPMDIALFEPNYSALSETQKSTLIPNRLLPKDPYVQNTEKPDVFVFIKVTVPVYDVTNINDNGTAVGSQHAQEIFFLKTEEEKEALFNSFHTKEDENDTEYWVELTDFEEGADYASDRRTYVFGYSVYLQWYEKTETLFDYIELKNIRQFEVNTGDRLNVTVDAYGIQADSLKDIPKDNATGKAVLTEEQLSTIFGYIEAPDEGNG